MRDLWYRWKGDVSDSAIENIIKLAESVDPQEGRISNEDIVNSEVRSSIIRWIRHPDVTALLHNYVHIANNDVFGVNLNGHCDVQFTEYHASKKAHYDWHHDVNWQNPLNFDRKLSVVIQLTDPSEYEGGDFEFFECENPDIKEKGSVVVFPSYLRHRVTPVLSGVRKSLVAWFSGPRWR